MCIFLLKQIDKIIWSVYFFLSRNMMNQSSSTYKTLKSSSLMPASQWWAWKSLSSVWYLDLTVHSLFCLVSFQSFTLEFHFEPNDFFTNTVLTKTYKMRSEPDESDPFSFDGPEIMGCTGYDLNFDFYTIWGRWYAGVHLEMFVFSDARSTGVRARTSH